MKLSGKMCLKIVLKITKKTSFLPLFRRYAFRKTTGGGGGTNWPPTPHHHHHHHHSRFRINCQEQLKTIRQTEKKKKDAFSSWEFALCHQLFFVTPFLNKSNPSKSFCSLRLGFQRAIYDVSKFFLVLAFFGDFEMITHVKQRLMLFRKCFDGSELLVGLFCSFHVTSALRLVSQEISAFFLHFSLLYCFWLLLTINNVC